MHHRQLRGTGPAWLGLCLALALHVADEAATGFLSVYNPTALALRERIPVLPLPVFDFETWLAGLIAAIAALTALSPFVFGGAHWTRPLAYTLGVLMAFNALGHFSGTLLGRTVGSLHFPRPMPGTYSSPFLLAASLYLLHELRRGPRSREN